MSRVLRLLPHDPSWRIDYEEESKRIRDVLKGLVTGIEHIGSTSIPGIRAKPIIDILLEVIDIHRIDERNEGMRKLGYECMGEYGIVGRRYFRKFNSEGERTHHVHAFERGSPHIQRHVAFRDYLRHHTEVAQEYSRLKQSLIDRNPLSAEAYMDGKQPFIERVEKEALKWKTSSSRTPR